MQVRRWMFFHTTTLSLMDAMDALANAAEAALTTQHRRSRRWWQLWHQPASTVQQQHDQGKSKQAPQQETGSGADIEAGGKGSQENHHPAPPASAAASDGLAAATGDDGHCVQQQSGIRAQQVSGAGQQQQAAPAGSAAAGTSARVGAATPAAVAAAAAQSVPSWGQWLHAGFLRHTAWVRPWLPLALNVQQYENIKFIVQQLPETFSSREGRLCAGVLVLELSLVPARVAQQHLALHFSWSN
jgi:hypothetical protein